MKEVFDNKKQYVQEIEDNGFKVMNDEPEMLKLILPKIRNQGDVFKSILDKYENDMAMIRAREEADRKKKEEKQRARAMKRGEGTGENTLATEQMGT